MDVSEVRRRVRAAIEEARRRSAERRTRTDAAAKAYERFLSDTAVPAFHQLANALVGEGQRFTVHSPAGSVRLASEHAQENFLELSLDESRDDPSVVIRVNRGRGRRLVTTERTLREGEPIEILTADDVVDAALADLLPLLER